MIEYYSDDHQDEYVLPIDEIQNFYLSDTFLEDYQDKDVPWGFGDLSWLTFKRSYAREVEGEDRMEAWWETCRRVIEGMFTIQKAHCHHLQTPWDNRKAQRMAKKCYDRMFHFKWTPPGRGIWMMGTDYIYEQGGGALNNCSFHTSKNIDQDFSRPFRWTMMMLMLGSGVGFDTRGAGKVTLQSPEQEGTHVVDDSKEGWVNLIARLLDSYVGKQTKPEEIDYSEIRPKGADISRFGGVAPGPEPLKKCYRRIDNICDNYVGEEVDSEFIVDIYNIIGACVVSGGVRRSAQLALGDKDDETYLDLKEDKDKVRKWRWASNNSILAEEGMDYSDVAKRTKNNGEPGYVWLENWREYGRMKDEPDGQDYRIMGCNPCQPSDASVLTPNGIDKIENVEEGDLVWAGDMFASIKNKWCTGVKEVYKYKTTAGVFLGTEDHRVVENGEKIEVKDANEIDLSQGPTPDKNCVESPQAVMDGLMIGDGGYHQASSTKLLYIGENDDDYHDSEISHLIKDSKFTVSKKGWSIDTTIDEDVLNDKMWERSVPDRYKYAEPYKVCDFLRGLYSADGSFCGGRVTLKSSSKQLVRDVQEMLSSIGIKSYITTNKSEDVEFSNGTYTCKESYDLNIGYQKGRVRFREMIGFIQNYKSDKLAKKIEETQSGGRSKNTYEIVEKEYVGEQKVYDIEVDHEEHVYWTQGVLVSNCVEIGLEGSGELCNLVENFPAHHESLEDFKETLKCSYLYSKTVSLVPTHDEQTNQVVSRNRRIGASVSGVVQAMNKHGRRKLLNWLDEGYQYIQHVDKKYSEWLGIPRSIKTTACKPSGSVSLLAGATPGVHWDHDHFYKRRVRIHEESPLVEACEDAGYDVEDAHYEDDTKVVTFPIEVENMERSKHDVSIWEKMELAALMQAEWADNGVSCTISFDPDEEGDEIARALPMFEDRLKAISFLPAEEHGYEQAPYESIDEAVYQQIDSQIRCSLKEAHQSTSDESIHDNEDKYCSSDNCEVDFSQEEE